MLVESNLGITSNPKTKVGPLIIIAVFQMLHAGLTILHKTERRKCGDTAVRRGHSVVMPLKLTIIILD